MKKKEKSLEKSDKFTPDANNPSGLSDNYNIAHDESIQRINETETNKISTRLYPEVVYKVIDEHGRVLCMDNPDRDNKRYAYFGSEKDYQQYVIPIQFSASPQYDESYVFGINDEVEDVVYLYELLETPISSYVYFDYYNSDPYFKEVKLTAEYIKTVKDQSQYKLIMNNKERHMFLYCPGTSSSTWDWLQLHSNNFTLMSFYPLHFENSIAKKRCKGVWSSRVPIKTSDNAYTPVSDEIAKKIYEDSGLKNYKWKQYVFDCDDFSQVYKAQACLEAYQQTLQHRYAVGIVWGRKIEEAWGHAVNLFIDEQLNVKIIENNGEIINAKDWEYIPTMIII